jgi:hypothetical protein
LISYYKKRIRKEITTQSNKIKEMTVVGVLLKSHERIEGINNNNNNNNSMK